MTRMSSNRRDWLETDLTIWARASGAEPRSLLTVRIPIDRVPDGVRLVVGMPATVQIYSQPALAFPRK